jgi:NAD+ diphosphatase
VNAVPFTLTGRPVLSRGRLNRQEPLLADESAQAELWSKARVLTVDQYGCVPTVAGGTELVYRPATEFGVEPPGNAVLLGERDGVGYWAVRISRPDASVPEWRGWRPLPDDGDGASERWLDLRMVGALLGATDAGAFTTAAAVLNWQRNAGFCAKCGSPVQWAKAGWASRCTGCGREEYPRTDPAVICLVHDGVGVNGENVLLARGVSWPEGRYSVLAGFVEAGESLEDCVVREISEETGVPVRDVRYLGNQPWPFPRSLMIGFTAVGDPSAPVYPADGEIAEARWVPRAVVRETFEAGGQRDGLALPGEVSIAGQMLIAWANTAN